LNRSSPEQNIPINPSPPRGQSKFSRSKVWIMHSCNGVSFVFKDSQKRCPIYSPFAM
jgi:hypothetical protein